MGSPNTRGKRGGGAAAALLAGDKPKIVDVSDEPKTTPGIPPVSQVPVEEHKRLQQENRAFMARMAQETPAQAAEADAEVPEVVKLPTPEEIAQRKHEEALGCYLAALIEMPDDEPRYIVGLRPPRPQFGGLRLELGDVVPGAAHWPRLDSWLRAGVVVPEALARRAG